MIIVFPWKAFEFIRYRVSETCQFPSVITTICSHLLNFELIFLVKHWWINCTTTSEEERYQGNNPQSDLIKTEITDAKQCRRQSNEEKLWACGKSFINYLQVCFISGQLILIRIATIKCLVYCDLMRAACSLWGQIAGISLNRVFICLIWV